MSENVNHDARLADYLGGEMAENDRARFERRLKDNPALAAEVDGLRRTLDAMRSIGAEAPRPVQAFDRPWRRWTGAVLRYAAVIGITFTVGYVSGGSRLADRHDGIVMQTPPSPQPPDRTSSGNDLPSPRWLERAAELYVSRRGSTGFGRSLVALAHAARPETDGHPAVTSPE